MGVTFLFLFFFAPFLVRTPPIASRAPRLPSPPFRYAGQNFSAELTGGDAFEFVNLPKRDRKANYDVDGEFARQMNKQPQEGRAKGQKLHDFQLFNVPRLEELRAKEALALERKMAARKSRTSGAGASLGAGGGDDGGEEEAEAMGLTRAEELEKAELLREGFADWTRKDLNAFIRGCELYGRANVRAVATEVEGKTEQEVARYASAFFRKYEQIENWDKIMKRIEVRRAARCGARPRALLLCSRSPLRLVASRPKPRALGTRAKRPNRPSPHPLRLCG